MTRSGDDGMQERTRTELLERWSRLEPGAEIPEELASELARDPELQAAVDRYAALVAEERAGAVPAPAVGAEGPIAGLRRRRRARRALAVAAVLAACVGVVGLVRSLQPAPASIGGPDVGGPVVAHSAGLISAKGADGRWRPLEGGALPLAAPIETGSDGRFTIASPSLSSVDVEPRTQVLVSAWSQAETRLHVAHGALRAVVSPRAAGQLYEVTTPLVRIRVVGTAFVARHDASGTTVEGLEGIVAVYRVTDGRELGRVRAGGRLRVPNPDRSAVAVAAPLVAPAPSRPAQPMTAANDPAPAAMAAPAPRPADDEEKVIASVRVRRSALIRTRRRSSRGLETVAVVAPTPPVPTAATVRIPKPAPVRARRRPKRRDAPSRTAPTPSPVPPTSTVSPPSPPAAPPAAPDPVERAAAERKAARDSLVSARRLLRSGKPDRAAEVLRPLTARMDGLGSQALGLMGDAHRIGGRFEQAERTYRLALKRHGRADPGALILDLGSLLAGPLGRKPATRTLYSGYLAKHPHGRAAAGARWWLADRDRAAGRRLDAEAHWATLVRDHASSRYAIKALVALGRAHLSRGEWTAALSLFESRATGAGALAERALYGLIRTHLGRGDRTAAERHGRDYLARFPTGGRVKAVRKLVERSP